MIDVVSYLSAKASRLPASTTELALFRILESVLQHSIYLCKSSGSISTGVFNVKVRYVPYLPHVTVQGSKTDATMIIRKAEYKFILKKWGEVRVSSC